MLDNYTLLILMLLTDDLTGPLPIRQTCESENLIVQDYQRAPFLNNK